MKKVILIGIAGASGSGKTSVAASIIKSLESDKAVIIQEDSYYKDLSDIPFAERKGRNFDHPDAFDHDLLARHLLQLLNGEAVSHPIYDYKLHTRSKETKTVGPGTLIILEGILVFGKAQLRELMDYRVFIDTPLDICFIRRLRRDVEVKRTDRRFRDQAIHRDGSTHVSSVYRTFEAICRYPYLRRGEEFRGG